MKSFRWLDRDPLNENKYIYIRANFSTRLDSNWRKSWKGGEALNFAQNFLHPNSRSNARSISRILSWLFLAFSLDGYNTRFTDGFDFINF